MTSFENNNSHNDRARSLENRADELDDKIAYAKLLVDVGVVTDSDDIPEEWFARVKEIAERSKITNVETARELAAIERLFALDDEHSFDEKIADAEQLIDAVITEMADSEIPNIDDDSIQLIRSNAVEMARTGTPFFDSVITAIADRKEMLKTNPSFDVTLDEKTRLVERVDDGDTLR